MLECREDHSKTAMLHRPTFGRMTTGRDLHSLDLRNPVDGNEKEPVLHCVSCLLFVLQLQSCLRFNIKRNMTLTVIVLTSI